MTWRKREIMDMAREAGIRDCTCSGEFGCLEAFAALVREDALAQPEQEPVALKMDALKDAFFEGFTSVETYNDSRLNSPEEAWAKYKPPVTPPVASVQQEPVGRVVSANCEYATVQWLRQTSEVGGGDPKNSRSWPIAGDAVYTTPPAAPVQEPSIPEGWERRTVVGFDALVEALDYAERKGFMPDYIASAWEGFNYMADESSQS